MSGYRPAARCRRGSIATLFDGFASGYGKNRHINTMAVVAMLRAVMPMCAGVWFWPCRIHRCVRLGLCASRTGHSGSYGVVERLIVRCIIGPILKTCLSVRLKEAWHEGFAVVKDEV